MANQYTGSQYTVDDCIESLQKATVELGHSPSGPEYLKTGIKPGVDTVKRLCGGWNKAKEMADLESWEGNPGYLSVNDTYFSEIDTAEKAYWLGFLYADGCVRDRDNQIALDLQRGDRGHVEEFSNALDSEYKITDFEHEGSEKTRTFITSEEMVEDLMSHGCIPNKTHKDTLPDLSDNMKPPFIRGYFDGDGCVGIYESADGGIMRQWVLTSSSTERLETMKGWIRKEVDISDKDIYDYEDKSPYIQYNSKSDLAGLCNYLLPNGLESYPRLDRKAEILYEFKDGV